MCNKKTCHSGGQHCHDSYRRWLSFLFGWRSAVVVTGLLAATDPFSPFCLLVSPVCVLGWLVGLYLPVGPPALCAGVFCVTCVHVCVLRVSHFVGFAGLFKSPCLGHLFCGAPCACVRVAYVRRFVHKIKRYPGLSASCA